MYKENFTKIDILNLLEQLNKKCQLIDIKSELILTGGTVMSLCYDARNTTKDIDCLFEPKAKLLTLIEEIAVENSINSNWLNDGVKGFIKDNIEYTMLEKMSNIKVYALSPKCMLALKLTAARLETEDMDDAIVLMKYLKIKSIDECYDIASNMLTKVQ